MASQILWGAFGITFGIRTDLLVHFVRICSCKGVAANGLLGVSRRYIVFLGALFGLPGGFGISFMGTHIGFYCHCQLRVLSSGLALEAALGTLSLQSSSRRSRSLTQRLSGI